VDARVAMATQARNRQDSDIVPVLRCNKKMFLWDDLAFFGERICTDFVSNIAYERYNVDAYAWVYTVRRHKISST